MLSHSSLLMNLADVIPHLLRIIRYYLILNIYDIYNTFYILCWNNSSNYVSEIYTEREVVWHQSYKQSYLGQKNWSSDNLFCSYLPSWTPGGRWKPSLFLAPIEAHTILQCHSCREWVNWVGKRENLKKRGAFQDLVKKSVMISSHSARVHVLGRLRKIC